MRFLRNSKWICKSLFDEKTAVLVPLSSSSTDLTSIFQLNETGLFIWESLHTMKTETELSESILSNFDLIVSDSQNATLTDLNEFLSHLLELGAIQSVP